MRSELVKDGKERDEDEQVDVPCLPERKTSLS